MTHLPAEPLRLAAVQAAAVPADVAANVRTAASLTVRAASEGARVVAFPELHLSAYDLPALQRDPNRCPVPADPNGCVVDRRLDPLVEIAAEHGVVVLVGAAVRHPDGTLTNSLLAVDSAGAAAAYDKQHLWQDDEARLFRAGDRGRVLTVADWRFGLGICYDTSFPEHARTAALAGAHVYLCASAFATGCEYRAAIYLAARALENTVYGVFVNPVAGPPHRPCSGGTAVYAPDGTTTGRVPVDREEVLLVDLVPTEIARVRSFLRMLAEVGTERASKRPPTRRRGLPE
jgi:predicted amidohydrolase